LEYAEEVLQKGERVCGARMERKDQKIEND
jgi:hypothetical protein